MPLGRVLLLGTELAWSVRTVVLLGLHRADGADFGIIPPKVSLRVEERVDMKARSRRPSSQLTKSQDQLLLQLVGEGILGPEEGNPTLGDCRVSVDVLRAMPCWQRCVFRGDDILVMARSRRRSSALGALSQSTRFALGNSRPMTGVTSKDSWASRAPESMSGLRRGGTMSAMGEDSIAEGAILVSVS